MLINFVNMCLGIGSRVKHPAYGEGVITILDGSGLRSMFYTIWYQISWERIY